MNINYTNMISIVFVILYVLFGLIPYGFSGVPQHSQNLGLYDANDKVISLTGNILKDQILDKNYSTLLEFYNSYCGHCRKFAPIYKKLANDLWPWKDILKVMAIDCAADENNSMCREYEIMAYPSLRYFSPHYKDDKHIGVNILDQDPNLIKTIVIKLLMNETAVKSSETSTSSWPNFTALNDDDVKDLFGNLPSEVHYVFIVFEPDNSTTAANLILDFYRYKTIQIRRVTATNLAKKFNIETFNTIAVIDRNSNVDIIPIANANSKSFHDTIMQFLKNKNIHETDQNQSGIISLVGDVINSQKSLSPIDAIIKTVKERNKEIITEVKKNKHLVYQSDLEHALRYSLFHEITKYAHIEGEKLLALQNYINVLVRYNPLGENGQKFLQKLREFILTHNQVIDGEVIQNELINLEKKFSPIFSSSHWVGCQSSKPNLRGFSCGLWQLFHFMTVQASENEKSTDPLEVLQAMHGYIKYFFGCTNCSNHFQRMAVKNKIWNTSSKDNAVLWLWSAHNEVNKRLAGDETEDPEFPKIQFPGHDSCPECFKEQSTSPIIINVDINDNINWDITEVLLFLKRIHNPQNISRFGIDDESVLPPTAEKLREKRLLGNVFSDLDMRMGIFLYIFCFGMMVIAVKLFLRKGYRKKTYSHDFLGKV